ncbi:MAG: hypothetical protein HY344_05085 [Candidatus Levybacteria bacterium]|nr:hypothetical protein [Candidatus Levybacteria bacterium]
MEFLSVNWNACIPEGIDAPTIACIPIIIKVIINWAFIFGAIVALFLIIYGGIRLINSGGDPKSVEGARKMLTFALIGLTVIFLSFFIINLIADFTGVELLKYIKLGTTD